MKTFKVIYRLIDEPLSYDNHVQIIRAESVEKAADLMRGAREDIMVLSAEELQNGK